MTKPENLTPKQIKQRLERLRREQYKIRAKNERRRTHLMCQMAGFVLTDILDYKEEDLYSFNDFSLKHWEKFCIDHKTEIIKCRIKQ